ncbi:MAG: hypothetical protein WBF44_18360 [Pseudolabrys sp.]
MPPLAGNLRRDIFTGMPKYNRNGAAGFAEIDHVTADERALRFAERAEREAADTRTEAQRMLGDPPADRSALAAKGRAPMRSIGPA